MEPNKIPEGVLNIEAYQDYLEMKEALEKSEEKVYRTSNPDIYIDFGTAIPIARKLAKDLPEAEQEYVENMAHKFSVLKGLVSSKKREAYMAKSENELETQDILKVRQSEVLEYFGRFFKITEVLKIINVDWGYEISRTRLVTFVKQNSEKILELQEEYKKDYSDIRLAYKRSRLDELSYIYSSVKQKYEQHEIREDAKLLVSLLDSIKKECDGDLVVNINAKVEIEQNVTMQIQNELMKEFNITALIINKMAGRLGVNPNFIQSRLANSHYAKFTGFKSLEEGESRYEDEIFSPSNIVYNLDDIENKNIEVTREENKKKLFPKIEGSDEQRVSSFRDMLKKKMAEEQDLINKSKSGNLKNQK